MRCSWISALLALAGCAGAVSTRSRDYDTMLGDLRREAKVHADGEAAFAAIARAPRLDRAALIRAVIARNPGIVAMREAWRAAAADVRAAGTLDDPMVTYELAPLSIASDARFGQRVVVTQKLPFPGKRGLAGDVAVADAAAAREDLRATELALAELASSLYDDYALAEQQLAVNEHHRMVTGQMGKAVEAQLAAGRGSTQDAIAAQVELGRMAQERVMIESQRAAIVARLNGLLHREPELALPPPADEVVTPAEPLPLPALVQAAAAARPDAAAAGERKAGREAEVARAERAYYPDLELMGTYDSMWDMPAHRWMIGVGIEVPLQRGKRDAQVDAANARVAQANAELDRVRDDVRVEVFRARREVVESNALVTSYDRDVLPAARAQVEAALAGFVSGRNDFTAVIAAERGARELELAAFRARADLSKRRSALDRATGHLPGGGAP